MANQQAKEQRIRATGQITHAMKMVATAKLEQCKRSSALLTPYLQALSSSFGVAAAQQKGSELHPLLRQRAVKRILLLLRSSDKGLCGGLNATLFAGVSCYSDQAVALGQQLRFLSIGQKGHRFLAKKRVKGSGNDVVYHAEATLEQSKQLSNLVVQAFLEGACDQVVVAYQGSSVPTAKGVAFVQLLPLVVPCAPLTQTSWLCEPDPAGLLAAMAPQLACIQLHSHLLAAELVEHKVRMLAMHQASENVDKMVEALRLDYHRARQAAITQEIGEIIGGFQALN